jgi:hypothetical protein
MKFILLLMYFTAPPAPPEVKDKDRVWSLQSTSVMEFSSYLGCNETGRSITTSMAKVNTITIRGWCFCELKGATCPGQNKKSVKLFSSRENDSDFSVGVETLTPPTDR